METKLNESKTASTSHLKAKVYRDNDLKEWAEIKVSLEINVSADSKIVFANENESSSKEKKINRNEKKVSK